MANWSNPTAGSLRADVLTNLKDRDVDAGTLYVSSPTNPVTGAFRFNRSTLLFEEWDSAAWQVKALSIAGGGTGSTTASAARTALGLDTMATQASNSVAITGGTISGLSTLGVSGTITAGLFSGSGASLTNIPNSATTATNANTASAIVARDASGNFTAGTITANLIGDVTGNADTATNGVVTSGSYSDPSWITALAATKLTGTIADARLSSNIPRLNAANSWSAAQTNGQQPREKSYRNSSVSISNTTDTQVTTTHDQFDIGAKSMINNGGSPHIDMATAGAGLYLVTMQVTFLAGGGSIRKLIAQDGSGNPIARDENVPSASQPTVCRVTFLYNYPGSGNSSLKMVVYQDSGGSLDVYGADESNTFVEIVKLW